MNSWRVAEQVAVGVTIVTALATGAVWAAEKVDHAQAPKAAVVVHKQVTYGAQTTVVYQIDITRSVTAAFINNAQQAFAAAVPRLVHDRQGTVRIYVRVISHRSGSDAAAVATYTIPPVPTCGANPFDQRCRQTHDAALASARSRAATIAKAIRKLQLKRTGTGTAVRGAFAAGGELLQETPGARWLVAATDLRPSSEPASSFTINLTGVRVVILLACDQSYDMSSAIPGRRGGIPSSVGMVRSPFGS